MSLDASAIERAPSPWAGRALLRRLALGDEVAHLVTLIFAFSIILITSLLVYQLWLNSAASRHEFGWHFWVSRTWDPVFEHFGAAPFIYGTLVTSAVALSHRLASGPGGGDFSFRTCSAKHLGHHLVSH